MKRTFGTALLLVLFALPSFAANKPQSVKIAGAVQVGATQLPAGDYKVSWTGTGTDVQVTISGKDIQPVTAKAVIANEKHDYSAVATNKVNGVQVLEEILLPNVTLTIQKSSTITGN